MWKEYKQHRIYNLSEYDNNRFKKMQMDLNNLNIQSFLPECSEITLL